MAAAYTTRSGKYRDGKRWRIYWRVGDQRYFASLKKSEYPKKKDAEREAFRREIEGEKLIKGNCSFRDFAYTVFSDNATPSFEKQDKLIRDVDSFLAQRSIAGLSQVTDTLLKQYIESKKSKYKPATVNRDITYLKQICNKALQAGIFRISPMKDINKAKEERVIKVLPTKEERDKILKWFLKNEPFFYAWLYFEVTRGWRKDEFRTMKIADVDLPGEKLYIRKAKIEPRVARLTEEDCIVLNEHILLLKRMKMYHPKGLLYPSQQGEFIGRNTLLRKIKKACRELGIEKNITNHLFRSYVVTSILDKTTNIEVVKAVTGHKDTKTILEHYAQATTENTEKGLEITRVNTGLLPKNLAKSVPKGVPRKK